MEIRKINDTISVGPQFRTDEMAELAKWGFKTVICNRPDGEDFLQPSFAEIAAEAAKHGITAHHVPMVAGRLDMIAIEQFHDVMKEAPGPVFAYCRTGTRSATLWFLDQVRHGAPVNDCLEATAAAGYDLSGMASRIPIPVPKTA